MNEKVFLKKLGQNIKRIRTDKGLTQTEVAYRCEFERPSIHRIEGGGTNPTAVTLQKLAEALEVSIQDFFNEPVVKRLKKVTKNEK